jgi:hypothetical protein
VTADAEPCVLGDARGQMFFTRDLGVSWSSLPRLPEGLSSPTLTRTPHGFLAVADPGGRACALLGLPDGAAAWNEPSPSWTAPQKPR